MILQYELQYAKSYSKNVGSIHYVMADDGAILELYELSFFIQKCLQKCLLNAVSMFTERIDFYGLQRKLIAGISCLEGSTKLITQIIEEVSVLICINNTHKHPVIPSEKTVHLIFLGPFTYSIRAKIVVRRNFRSSIY